MDGERRFNVLILASGYGVKLVNKKQDLIPAQIGEVEVPEYSWYILEGTFHRLIVMEMLEWIYHE